MEAGFGDPAVARVVGWQARVSRMIEVEAALARALADVGVISVEAAEAIGRTCAEGDLDLAGLALETSSAITPVIPLLAALRSRGDELASAWLHHGATSQDVIDTAVALQVRDAIEVITDRLVAVADQCAELADAHRKTVTAGRTLGQQATPITFGLKAARWLGAFDRRIEQMRWVRGRILTVQLGGAAGTSAAYGPDGLVVAQALARELDLAVPDLPWHAERDRIVELAGALAAIASTVGSVATDLVLLAQSEVAEVHETTGAAPSSSAIPHKRNPLNAVAARAASRLALGELTVLIATAGDHEHERAAGAWQAEWVALPSALVRTAGSLKRLDESLRGLEVDSVRAQENLDALHGLTGSEGLATALTEALGRPAAQALVGELATTASGQRRSLADVATEDVRIARVLDPGALAAALDPARALQLASTLIDRALGTHTRTVSRSEPL